MRHRVGKENKKPKSAPYKGKRLRCAACKKRSPHKVLMPAPWYCPACSPDPKDAVSQASVLEMPLSVDPDF